MELSDVYLKKIFNPELVVPDGTERSFAGGQ